MTHSDRIHWTITLAAQRARLLHAYIGLTAEQINTTSDDGGWTLAEMFAHVNAWETRVANLLPTIFASDTPAVPSVDAAQFHRQAFADMRARGFVAVLRDLTQARQAMLASLAAASDEAIARERTLPSGKPFTVRRWAIQELADHDGEHAEQVRATRKARGVKLTHGPKPILEAAFAAAHDYLMACAACVPTGQEATLKVTGEWTLKDVLGHIADWHFVIADAVEGALSGKPLTQVQFSKLQQWNEEHAAARAHESWAKVKGDYDQSWRRVSDALARVSEADFATEAAQGERGPIALSPWLFIAVHHEEEHAGFLREWVMGD